MEARSEALSKISDVVIVDVRLILNERFICSCNSWDIDKFLSKAVSKLSAGKGSFSIKSNPWVWVVFLLNITVSPVAGILPLVKVTVPPDEFPTPETV